MSWGRHLVPVADEDRGLVPSCPLGLLPRMVLHGAPRPARRRQSTSVHLLKPPVYSLRAVGDVQALSAARSAVERTQSNSPFRQDACTLKHDAGAEQCYLLVHDFRCAVRLWRVGVAKLPDSPVDRSPLGGTRSCAQPTLAPRSRGRRLRCVAQHSSLSAPHAQIRPCDPAHCVRPPTAPPPTRPPNRAARALVYHHSSKYGPSPRTPRPGTPYSSPGASLSQNSLGAYTATVLHGEYARNECGRSSWPPSFA